MSTFEEIPGESPRERGVRKALLGQTSEFGEGVVVPLLYWAKHFMSDGCTRIHYVDEWIKMGMPSSMVGQYDKSFVEAVDLFVKVELSVQKQSTWGKTAKPEDIALSGVIESFFYQAADHLYGLQVCSKFSDALNQKIEKLRDMGLTYRMFRHNEKGKLLTVRDLNEAWELTKEIALEIDQTVLGVEDADLGEYD